MLQVTLQVTASPRPRCRPRGGHVTGHAGPDAITQGQGGSTDPLTTLKVNLEASVLRFSICGTTISTGQYWRAVGTSAGLWYSGTVPRRCGMSCTRPEGRKCGSLSRLARGSDSQTAVRLQYQTEAQYRSLRSGGIGR
eukprot:3599401-Rhodomonas_salina.2